MSTSIVQVTNLTKSYNRGKIKAVDEVSFSVDEGEVYGLIGPNGAGKTTIMGCLLSLLHPNSGEVKIDGKFPDDRSVRKITGFLPERPSYNRWYTVESFLKFHHMLAQLPDSQSEQAIDLVLEKVKLTKDVKTKTIKELSRGMLQRLGLAQMIIGKPKLCFLDEPTSGMDPLGFILIRDILKEFKEKGVTVVLNSHHLQEVESVCDRVAFIRKGKIEAVESLKNAQGQAQVLIVKWIKRDESVSVEKLENIAEIHSASLIDSKTNLARFSIEGESSASDLINALYQADIKVYESNFEKKSLVNLFMAASNDEEKEKERDD